MIFLPGQIRHRSLKDFSPRRADPPNAALRSMERYSGDQRKNHLLTCVLGQSAPKLQGGKKNISCRNSSDLLASLNEKPDISPGSIAEEIR